MSEPLKQNPPGLYIHIPFCVSKCPYCNFYSVTDRSNIPRFIACLVEEMGLYTGHFDRFDTVYFGGGTPSTLSPAQLETILDAVCRHFAISKDAEITCELNPGDVSSDYLASLRAMGINRLTIGIQSFDEPMLTFLGRRHSTPQSMAALELSRRAGFENIGLDLIYGIPGQSLKSWERGLHRAISYEPEHISCYELTIEPGTPLHRRYRDNEFAFPKEDLLYEFFTTTSRLLVDAGYVHYEVSNFAGDMHLRSRHNQKYWDQTPYLGIGPAAHSFHGNRRWWNHPSLDGYVEHLQVRRHPPGGTETLSISHLRNEALYLALRTKQGIDLSDFLLRYDCDILKEKKDAVTRLCNDRLIEIIDGRLQPTARGLALADSIYSEL